MTVLSTISNAAAYTWGQCTYYAAKVATYIPAGLGNAADWLAGARAKGLATSSKPVPGAVVVYGRGGLYSAANGHVAVVQSVNPDGTFVVTEMNYRGFDQVDTRTSTMQGVEGFILPPAGQGGPSMTTTSQPGGPDLLPILLGPAGLPIDAVTGFLGDQAQKDFEGALSWFAGLVGQVLGVIFKAAARGAGALTGGLINGGLGEVRKHVVAVSVAAVILVVAFTQ